MDPPPPCTSDFLWGSLPIPITFRFSFTGIMVKIQDYTKALEVLKEYPSGDGLHVDTLLDSDSHGALTYNDFLILPGSISKAIKLVSWLLLIL